METPNWETYCNCGKCMLCQAVKEVNRLRMLLGNNIPELTEEQAEQLTKAELKEEIRVLTKANRLQRKTLTDSQETVKKLQRQIEVGE